MWTHRNLELEACEGRWQELCTGNIVHYRNAQLSANIPFVQNAPIKAM